MMVQMNDWKDLCVMYDELIGLYWVDCDFFEFFSMNVVLSIVVIEGVCFMQFLLFVWIIDFDVFEMVFGCFEDVIFLFFYVGYCVMFDVFGFIEVVFIGDFQFFQ